MHSMRTRDKKIVESLLAVIVSLKNFWCSGAQEC